MQHFGRWSVLTTLFIAMSSASLADDGVAVPPEDYRFFETRIRPLLANHCYKCHGPKKQEGGLRLDSLAGILKGGDAGPAAVQRKPKQSLLLTAVGYRDEDLKMPPDKKLSDRQIADLTRWVSMGTPYPGQTAAPVVNNKAIDFERARKFWAFQPVRPPVVPTVKDLEWPTSDLDRLVLIQLEAHDLRPAPAADKRTLIRRATFDLIGLPPTRAEIQDFLNDNSPDAFAHVVDRLLSSKHYGERWGRHWLDVARYADSNGLDENVAHGNAWRYRDYVVAAFNNDKPYDHFLLEQLAGDLLPNEDKATAAQQESARIERLIATGFLALGPKLLAEVDETKMEMDIVDEQVDTICRSLLGLTMGCSRCHDHKFDPIAQEDYYALAGIFKSTRTMLNFKKVAKWYENPIATSDDLARKAAHDKQVAEHKQAINSLIKAANQKLISESKPGFKLPKNPESLYPKKTQTQLKTMRDAFASLEKTAPELSTAMGVSEATVADVPVHIRGSHLTLGETVARGFPRVLTSASDQTRCNDKQSGRLELARWLVGKDHPLTARVMANRIWRWHFGQGIVRTPDNFGKLGERPTNQPLLDWLADRFVGNGWSIKQLHRTIMLSRTYQMSSQYNATAAAADPANRLQWRFDVRRLEAEAVRDSLLAVSGRLDTTIGGSLLKLKNRAYVFNHTSEDATTYDSPRRSIYLPVIRNHLYDVFQLFDYSDASVMNGNRASTTVAPQALFLMNSEFVTDITGSLADRVTGLKAESQVDRIEWLYETAYGRLPDDGETARARSFMERFSNALPQKKIDTKQRQRRVWQSLCQVLLASNEFIHVR